MKTFHHMIMGLALTATLFLTGCGPEPVAKLDGVAITQEEFMSALENGVGLREGPSTGRRVLDTIITRRLVEKAAAEQDVTVSEEEINKALEDFKEGVVASMRTGSFEAFLKDTGLTEEHFRDQFRISLLVEKLVVTDLEIEEYFTARSQEFDKPEQRTFYQMFLNTKEDAEAVRKEVVEGKKDFAEVAKEKSVKAEGYALPPGGIPVTFAKGVPLADHNSNFADALFSMKEGEVTEPLLTKYPIMRGPEKGKDKIVVWRLVYMDSISPEKKATLEDSRKNVMRRVFNRKSARGEVAEYIRSLKAKARLEIIDPKYALLGEEFKRLAQEMPEFKPPTPPAPGEEPEPLPGEMQQPF
ncbi:MAG: hypothetical protein GTO55_04910 [Armatimonadetes bacterium]|nr:hypothetical protein [Armatimonadota bacterium]NIM23607.1 hypothetical protein [Armatimonadota bacterium]NIM67473.1 hypothetical protein [Armatimonadota bacterium]NIM75970.1 hypothetical protein [Armatimonadota bacterium]NIN05659.1 hypothetical protein [Armatimonadota bacterium]